MWISEMTPTGDFPRHCGEIVAGGRQLADHEDCV
jgi:hypothetical protein